jgi:hypothetical protein
MARTMEITSSDSFLAVFGRRRGASRPEPPVLVSREVRARVLCRTDDSVDFMVADARPQLREMAESLWVLYHRPQQAAPHITLAAKLCAAHGGEVARAFGLRPDGMRVWLDRNALMDFVGSEFPRLTDPRLLAQRA